MQTWSSERGLSLVEATIILMVLATLATVIRPTIVAFANDAKQVTATKDVASIGSAILQVLRDSGSRCLRLAGTTDCTMANRVDLLVSGGANPGSVLVADVTFDDNTAANQGTFNWLPSTNAPQAGQQDTIDDQLIENDNATPYSTVSFPSAGGGPRMKLGWRGAYLNGPIGGDPWGNKYQANTIFLTVATDAIDAGGNQSQEGLRETAWSRDTLILSAGANGDVETSFGGATAASGVSAGGDDVIYVIRGGSR